ncbi:SGNH/GDSL hydrolase family protein [Lentibacter sp. XHP0401]|uniref:SGNH/GDSL hydrolase family protein n=1 Tax=Lentibacter sp. XHP0401 TaxID=2984334 RepID=UPI0021E87E71|nr:SGNH/GDSL hydrolase family protein [Lentibacter sp. XHP0401]MCV2894423.1 SGNH/GDSL hydrolase family protein [Lentibacter sp. XHP0401]
MLAKIALSPLLAVQALQVRARALQLPEPDGTRTGQAGQGAPLRLLIVGDSSAAGVGASHQTRALTGQLSERLSVQHNFSWQLEAKTGATTALTIAHLNALPAQAFDAALVVLGVNDVTRLVRPKVWLEQQQTLHSLLQHKFEIQHIYRSGLPPMAHFSLLPQPLRRILGADAARLDHALAQLCAASTALTHIPLDLPFASEYLAEDGFHPSEAAYARWAELLTPHFLKTP